MHMQVLTQFVFLTEVARKSPPPSRPWISLSKTRSHSRGSCRAVVYNFNQRVNSVSAVTRNRQSLVAHPPPHKLIGFRPPVASAFSSLTTSHPSPNHQRVPLWEAAVSHSSDLWNDDRGASQAHPSVFIALVCSLPALLPPPPPIWYGRVNSSCGHSDGDRWSGCSELEYNRSHLPKVISALALTCWPGLPVGPLTGQRSRSSEESCWKVWVAQMLCCVSASVSFHSCKV